MKFEDLLENPVFATTQQEKTEIWNVEGVLSKRFNQSFKFDTRPLSKKEYKLGYFKSKADKIVIDMKDKYIIIDAPELHDYIKRNKIKEIKLEEILNKLDWNVTMEKNNVL